jgi:EAL domain-containing protein (putative c-di-GMP-specific phosphodiesterase class I)/GGDEF domain-containing protein
MSMTRQLWLSILASMLIALAASLFASLLNARSYLEAQLAMKNQDNAAALALALSQGSSDRDSVVLAVTALYDSGHYELIQVIDPQGSSLVNKVAIHGDAGAPDWFVRLLPIRSLPGRAEIASGWQPLGTLTLMSRAEFAYRSLWKTALTMSGVILAAGVLGGLLASLVLRRITGPMRAVVEQAHAINEHRFITMAVPGVPELRELATAMNDTVNRLRQDFEEDARRYEQMRRQANFDPLTGLANRVHFLASLESALDIEGSPYGALAIVRLRKLGKINRGLGREVADQLLRRVGATVEDVAGRCAGSLAGRLNGADFALLLPAGCDPAPTLNELLLDLPNILEPLAGQFSTTYIGFSAIVPGDNPTRLLARIDAALAAADVEGVSAVREAPVEHGAEQPAGGEEWRAVLRQTLDGRDRLKLAHYPMRVGDGETRHLECPLRLRPSEGGDWLPAGRFLPIADRLGLVWELDLVTLNLAIAELELDEKLAGLWINLSAKSIADPEFRRRMLDLLAGHPASRDRLHVEIPESGGLARLEALRALSRDLKPLGCKLGLEHYGHHFNQVGRLYELGLDFLKVDPSFIHGLDTNPGNQAFLAGLLEIAHRIGMQVFAEGVERSEELARLEELGFDGASGPLVA